jgi:hypothetical protein
LGRLPPGRSKLNAPAPAEQCRSVIDVGWSCPLPGGCGFSVRRPLAARLP